MGKLREEVVGKLWREGRRSRKYPNEEMRFDEVGWAQRQRERERERAMAISGCSTSSSAARVSLKWAAAVVLVICMVRSMEEDGGGAMAVSVDCNNVNRYFVPCFGYLLGNGAAPSAQCCANVKSLNSQSKGPVRAAVCQSIPGLNQQRASSLPQLCNIPLGLKITPTTDCSRYATALYLKPQP